MKPLLSCINTLTWKKLTIYCVSLITVFCAGIAINQACGPEPDPYDYYVNFFHNNLSGNTDYRSFYFNGYLFLNDVNEQVDEKGLNANEWAAYLGNGVKAKDVQFAMYGLKHKADSALLATYLYTRHKLPDSLKSNTFLKLLVSGKNPAALQYYRLSKTVENIGPRDIDNWDPRPIDSVALKKFGQLALTNANKERDSFLRLRYFYQAQRLLHYAGEINEAMKVYDNYIIKIHSQSHVMGWALSLKAGEESRLNNDAKAAYLFSKVFAEYPERRVQAYLDFFNINVPVKNIIKFAANNNEKAFIYAIEGFHESSPGLTAAEKVYQYQPNSPLVETLLTREINKLEESYLSPKLNGIITNNNYYETYITNDTLKKTYITYIPQLKTFCKKLALEHKSVDPGLGYLALAYLDWMQQHNTEGFAALAALDTIRLNTRLNDQKQLIKLLLISQKIKKLDNVNEAELLPSLKWLDQKVKWEANHVAGTMDSPYFGGTYDLKFFSASARDFYSLVLAAAYLKQKDTARAALAILKSERTIIPAISYYGEYGDEPGSNLPDFWQRNLHSHYINKILKWKNDTTSTAYLRCLMSAINKSDMGDIYDLLGTTYLREHNYKQAVKAFKLIPAKKFVKVLRPYDNDDTIYANPFISHMRDYPKLYTSDATQDYSPLRFAQKMLYLQNKIKTDPENAANYYYKMATGLYNTSYYGNSWGLISYNWSSYDNTRAPRDYYDGDYLECITAEKYYLKARQLSKNNEFKARCTFMAAKCKQKQTLFPEDNFSDPDMNKYYSKVKHNPYFNELESSYSHTSFYKLAISECSYLSDFLSAAHKPLKKKS